jgi:hypothetical protein
MGQIFTRFKRKNGTVVPFEIHSARQLGPAINGQPTQPTNKLSLATTNQDGEGTTPASDEATNDVGSSSDFVPEQPERRQLKIYLTDLAFSIIEKMRSANGSSDTLQRKLTSSGEAIFRVLETAPLGVSIGAKIGGLIFKQIGKRLDLAPAMDMLILDLVMVFEILEKVDSAYEEEQNGLMWARRPVQHDNAEGAVKYGNALHDAAAFANHAGVKAGLLHAAFLELVGVSLLCMYADATMDTMIRDSERYRACSIPLDRWLQLTMHCVLVRDPVACAACTLLRCSAGPCVQGVNAPRTISEPGTNGL